MNSVADCVENLRQARAASAAALAELKAAVASARSEGASITALARDTGTSRVTIYSWLGSVENNHE